MSIFITTKNVTVNVVSPSGAQKGAAAQQGITLQVRDDLDVELAIAYQKHCDAHEDDNFEKGIALLLAYVEGWQVDGADQATAWGEAALRRVKLTIFEALVVAVSNEISPPEPESEDEAEHSPKNA